MERGWKAEGLLRPLWNNYEGGRDVLARTVGTSPTVLSSINSGKRPLGMNLGLRLANELGVSVFDLGAPARDAGDFDTVAYEIAREINVIQQLILNRLPAPPGSVTAQVSNATGLAEIALTLLRAGEPVEPGRPEELADAVEMTAQLALDLASELRGFAEAEQTAP